MGKGPDEIRQDIERTRNELGDNVDLLTEKVSPARVVGRRVDKARRGITNVKETVMGSAGSGVSTLSDTASEAPQQIQRKAQGNPLAAGLIAFGAGWLVASVIPASRQERQLVSSAKEQAGTVMQPVADELGSAAQQIKEGMREPAKQSVESVKSSAQDAARTVGEQARPSG
jgi:hypothetical protein